MPSLLPGFCPAGCVVRPWLLAGGQVRSGLPSQGWNKQWDEWVEQEGLHKFKKELLDVRLDGGENSAQGTADAKYAPTPPVIIPHVLLGLCITMYTSSATAPHSTPDGK